MALSEKEILMYLEELPDDNDLTDIESDDDNDDTQQIIVHVFQTIILMTLSSRKLRVSIKCLFVFLPLTNILYLFVTVSWSVLQILIIPMMEGVM